MYKSLILLVISVSFTCFVSKGQVNGDRNSVNVNMLAVDQLVKLEMDKQHIFGLSLGIIHEGKVIAVKGYGLANIEQSAPATEKTVYKIGSVSKQMIATAIMLFVQTNKLKLTDSLPAFFKDAPTAWNKITVRHLLNHTSGLPRESPILDNMKEQSDSLLIRAAYNSNLLFEPGTSWKYCNLGYFMLADIIRQLSGQSFTDFMQNQLFRKYGLDFTRTTSTTAIVKNKADGYVYKTSDNIFKARDYIALRPSGAFLSNITDLVKWEMLLQSDALLAKESREQMWNDKVRVSNSVQDPIEYYGYGWDVNEYKGLRVVHHDGTLPGFASSYFRFIDNKSAIIILTNADNAYPKTLALQIADLMFQ
jgi:CubicO group peptidase (beta-lactamase class C family)